MDELIKAINSSNKYNPKIIKSLVSIIQNEKPSLSLFLKSLMNLSNEIYILPLMKVFLVHYINFNPVSKLTTNEDKLRQINQIEESIKIVSQFNRDGQTGFVPKAIIYGAAFKLFDFSYNTLQSYFLESINNELEFLDSNYLFPNQSYEDNDVDESINKVDDHLFFIYKVLFFYLGKEQTLKLVDKIKVIEEKSYIPGEDEAKIDLIESLDNPGKLTIKSKEQYQSFLKKINVVNVERFFIESKLVASVNLNNPYKSLVTILSHLKTVYKQPFSIGIHY